MIKNALILGIGGQDGSYLADILVDRGISVSGMYRKSSVDNLRRIRHLTSQEKVTVYRGDLTDTNSVCHIIESVNPDVIFNMADQDNIDWSYSIPSYSIDTTLNSVVRIYEYLRRNRPSVRFFQPVSAMMFRGSDFPQAEQSRIDPTSPYACAKAGVYFLSRFYRRAYNLPIFTGIMYNHDSPRRSPGYLLQHIASEVIAVQQRKQRGIRIANPSAVVDIGYAREYMEAVVEMMDRIPSKDASDFIISTEIGHTIRELVESVTPPDREILTAEFNRPGGDKGISSTYVGNSAKFRTTMFTLGYTFNPKWDAKKVLAYILHLRIMGETE